MSFKHDNPRVFKALFDEAQKSELIGPSRHSACIVHNGIVLAKGRSKRKTHPMQAKYQSNENRVYLHAEIDAIVKVINRYGPEILERSDIYVLRITKGDNIGYSKPCAGCQKAIDAWGLRNTFYT